MIKEYSREQLFNNSYLFHTLRNNLKRDTPTMGERMIYWFLGNGYGDWDGLFPYKETLRFDISPDDEDEDVINNYIAWHVNPRDNEEAELDWIEININNRKKGEGRKLLLSFETEAKSIGVKKITLECRERNFEFYKKCGYHQVGEPTENDVGEAEKVKEYNMEKVL